MLHYHVSERRGETPRTVRRGATAVEMAIVLPVVVMMTLGAIVWGLGVFRYHQVADLAREAARYAVTHGGNYTREGHGTLTQQEIIDEAVTPKAVGLSPLEVTVKIITSGGEAYVWDDSYWGSHNRTYDLQTDIGTGQFNRVRVTVSYAWVPEIFGLGPINLTSTSEMQMSY